MSSLLFKLTFFSAILTFAMCQNLDYDPYKNQPAPNDERFFDTVDYDSDDKFNKRNLIYVKKNEHVLCEVKEVKHHMLPSNRTCVPADLQDLDLYSGTSHKSNDLCFTRSERGCMTRIKDEVIYVRDRANTCNGGSDCYKKKFIVVQDGCDCALKINLEKFL